MYIMSRNANLFSAQATMLFIYHDTQAVKHCGMLQIKQYTVGLHIKVCTVLNIKCSFIQI